MIFKSVTRAMIVFTMLIMLFSACAEDDVWAQAAFNEVPQMLEKNTQYKMDGSVLSTLPLSSVTLEVFNESSLKNDYEKTASFNTPVYEYALEKLLPAHAFYQFQPGEKTLIITCKSGDMIQEACRLRFTILGVPKEPRHITDTCKFTMSGFKRLVVEGEYSDHACWKPASASDPIRITLTQTASLMRIDWLTPPTDFLVECLDEAGAVQKTYEAGENYEFYTDQFEIGEGVREIRITLIDTESAICAVRVYGENAPTVDMPDFLPMPEKLDLMVISTHQDDELLMFGGAIPYYTATGKEVGVVYMTNCGRHRYQEAMNGLWMAGVPYHPVFIGLRDKHTSSVTEAFNLWISVDNTVSELVEAIRKHKPDVVMTHGKNGEYGHNQHKATSEALLMAVEAAANPEKYPESYEKYGAWQVKKTYRHETGEGHIHIDWDVPMDAYDGRTPQQISEIAYCRHTSQYYGGVKFTLGSYYDYYGYTLIASTVGPDVIGGDFFENIR